MAKRYYWLKLKEDFFDSKRIKKLRRVAGGDTFTIIYLKMQLKAMKQDGMLYYDGLESSVAEELALDLDEDVENVQFTLNYLVHCGLAETSNNEAFFLPYAVENTGSETGVAQRVRECRERKKIQEPQQDPAPPKTGAERQRNFRAKQYCEDQPHIPMIEDHMNKKRYGGNYYIVFKRDDCKCVLCGSQENLCVHHIDGYDESNPESCSANRMITLCRKCHSNVHAGNLSIGQDILGLIGYTSNVTVTKLCNNPVTERKRKIEEKELYIESEGEIEGSGGKEDIPPLELGMYGNVVLTPSDYERLKKVFPGTDRAIERLSQQLFNGKVSSDAAHVDLLREYLTKMICRGGER